MRNAKKKFSLEEFLTTVRTGPAVKQYAAGETVFCQEDSADAVFYLKQGQVKLAVVSRGGKEAVLTILSEGMFFGEGCLTGQTVRMSTASAVSDVLVIRTNKQAFSFTLGFPTLLREKKTRLQSFNEPPRPHRWAAHDELRDVGDDGRMTSFQKM